MRDSDRQPLATAFAGSRIVARGMLADVALAVKSLLDLGGQETVLVFDDRTGRAIDLDLRGTGSQIVARYAPKSDAPKSDAQKSGERPAGRGRPRLGVVAREVTLLPRHWDWLSAQPGGASQALRRLVDKARLEDGGATAARKRRDAAYAFMSAMAGDLPNFEDASRALFAGDTGRLRDLMSAWPRDVRGHALALAGPDSEQ